MEPALSVVSRSGHETLWHSPCRSGALKCCVESASHTRDCRAASRSCEITLPLQLYPTHYGRTIPSSLCPDPVRVLVTAHGARASAHLPSMPSPVGPDSLARRSCAVAAAIRPYSPSPSPLSKHSLSSHMPVTCAKVGLSSRSLADLLTVPIGAPFRGQLIPPPGTQRGWRHAIAHTRPRTAP